MKQQCKVLIVDDNPTNIAILEEILGDYNLKNASSGQDALELVNEYHPDLILLDIMMPGMTGYEVCRRLRENSEIKQPKIIMVSAKAMVSERLKGYEMGADDYITKPFEEDELLAKVRVYERLTSVEAIDQLKTELLRLLCLDTVNPLSSIVNPLKGLLSTEKNLNTEECKRKIAVSYKNAVSLQKLFEKVVLWSSIKSGKVKFNFAPGDFSAIVRSTLADVEPLTKERKLTIRQVLSERALTQMDSAEIKRVVLTLLDNAIRFSPDNGRIIIEMSEADNSFYLSIIDEGKGIDPNFLPQVFKEFTYMEVNKNNAEWHGLSLSTAQLIMQAHNGRIEIDSNKASGTIVTMILPKKDADSAIGTEVDQNRPKTVSN